MYIRMDSTGIRICIHMFISWLFYIVITSDLEEKLLDGFMTPDKDEGAVLPEQMQLKPSGNSR